MGSNRELQGATRNVDICLKFPQIGIVNVQQAARAVEARRGELRLTQQQLADAAGVDVKTIGSLESRGRWPIARTRAAIERALKWPPGEMARIADEADRSPPTQLREETREAIRRDLGGDPVLAEQVIAFVEGVASGRIPPASAGHAADPPEAGPQPQRGRALASAARHRTARPCTSR